MSDSETSQEQELPSSLELLKKKADTLGVTYHPNIGETKLLERVREAQKPKDKLATAVPAEVIPTEVQAAPTAKWDPKETQEDKANRLRKEARRLVRVIVTCMNPNKKSMSGDYYTLSNSVVGTIKKFVQFDAPEGWHVENMIVDHLKSNRCQIFVPGKNKAGKKIMVPKLINEYAVVELPPLTAADLKELAERQALAGNID